MGKLMLPVVHTSVFGITPTGGNPCPVVFDADNLTAEQMRSLAAHFQSETVFILPPTQPNVDLRLRYFVPNHEMEMCVHATVGTVTVLISHQHLTHSPVKIETPLGVIRVNWDKAKDISINVEQFLPTFSTINPTCAEVAQVLRIPETAIDLEIAPIQSVSTSRFKLMIPIRDYATLDSLQPDFEQLWALCDRYQTTGFYPFTTQTRQDNIQVGARQFPKRAGYNEDPATGVAACALGAYLTHYQVFGGKSDGWYNFQVEQGYAMGCASVMQAGSYLEAGQIVKTRVGGQATIISNEMKSL